MERERAGKQPEENVLIIKLLHNAHLTWNIINAASGRRKFSMTCTGRKCRLEKREGKETTSGWGNGRGVQEPMYSKFQPNWYDNITIFGAQISRNAAILRKNFNCGNFDNIQGSIFCTFGLRMLIQVHKMGLWGISTPKWGVRTRPQKASLRGNTSYDI